MGSDKSSGQTRANLMVFVGWLQLDAWIRLFSPIGREAVRHMLPHNRGTVLFTGATASDHRGIKGRYQPMRGFKCPRSADRLCRGYDELRNLFRSAPALINIFPPSPADSIPPSHCNRNEIIEGRLIERARPSDLRLNL